MLFHIIAIALLLVLSALFSGSETALFSLTVSRQDRLREDNPKLARRVGRLLGSPARLLGTILVVNLLVNVSASAIATLVVVNWAATTGRTPAVYLGVGGLVMTGLLLVFGEVTPKLVAVRRPTRFLRVAVPIISLARVLFAPVVRVLEKLGNRIALSTREKDHLSEDELRTMVQVGRERGVVAEREEDILWSLVELSERTVSEVMTPRISMIAIAQATSVEDARAVCRANRFSRLPVYDGAIDHIVGIVYAKELLLAEPDLPVSGVMREVTFVPEAKRLPMLLDELRKKGYHIAIVVDEFGQTAGLVTLEDILEAIFGEITDEYDEPGELPWRRLAKDSYEVEGEIDIATLNRLFRGRFEDTEQERLAGFVHDRLGRLPEPGDSFNHGGVVIEVNKVSENKLEKAVVRWAEENNEER